MTFLQICFHLSNGNLVQSLPSVSDQQIAESTCEQEADDRISQTGPQIGSIFPGKLWPYT